MSSGQASWGATGSSSAGETISLPASGLAYQVSEIEPKSGQREISCPVGAGRSAAERRIGVMPKGATPAKRATGSAQAPAAFTSTGAVNGLSPAVTCQAACPRWMAVTGAQDGDQIDRVCGLQQVDPGSAVAIGLQRAELVLACQQQLAARRQERAVTDALWCLEYRSGGGIERTQGGVAVIADENRGRAPGGMIPELRLGLDHRDAGMGSQLSGGADAGDPASDDDDVGMCHAPSKPVRTAVRLWPSSSQR